MDCRLDSELRLGLSLYTLGFVNLPNSISASETVVLSASGFDQGTMQQQSVCGCGSVFQAEHEKAF